MPLFIAPARGVALQSGQATRPDDMLVPSAADAVAVIIVNWNRKADTLRCLASLAESVGPRLDVLVVDNASSDDSANAIRAVYPDVRLIVNDRNDGFAEGNNIALREALRAGYAYVLLLNNDTIVAPTAIEQLLAELHADPAAGVVSPAICYVSQPTTTWSAGGSISWKHGEVASAYLDAPLHSLPPAPYRVDHVSGCCMLLRADAIRAAGLLDPRFFMYYEETEWCVRIGRCGYTLWVVPQAVIWHAIEPARQAGSPAIAYYMTRNHLLFLKATHAPARAWLITVFRQLRTVTSLFIKPTSLARKRGRVPMLRAMRDFAFARFGPMTGA
jgi:GT2 family glycosyltransferase